VVPGETEVRFWTASEVLQGSRITSVLPMVRERIGSVNTFDASQDLSGPISLDVIVQKGNLRAFRFGFRRPTTND
jgi:hypothetical protein